MKNLSLLLVLLGFVTTAFSQVDTLVLYSDKGSLPLKNWVVSDNQFRYNYNSIKMTSQDTVVKERISKNANSYLIVFDKNRKLIEGSYSFAQGIFIGEVIYYYPSGKVRKVRTLSTFDEGDDLFKGDVRYPKGIWICYDKKGNEKRKLEFSVSELEGKPVIKRKNILTGKISFFGFKDILKERFK